MTFKEIITNAPEFLGNMYQFMTNSGGDVSATFIENGQNKTYTFPTANKIKDTVPDAVKSGMLVYLYVDPVLGDDTNDGSFGNPMKTLVAAIDSSPVSCRLYLNLISGATYNVDKEVWLFNRSIELYGDAANPPLIVQQQRVAPTGGVTTVGRNGQFSARGGNSLFTIYDCVISTHSEFVDSRSALFVNYRGNLSLLIVNDGLLATSPTAISILINGAQLAESLPGMGLSSVSLKSCRIFFQNPVDTVAVGSDYLLSTDGVTALSVSSSIFSDGANTFTNRTRFLKYAGGATGVSPRNVTSNIDLKN